MDSAHPFATSYARSFSIPERPSFTPVVVVVVVLLSPAVADARSECQFSDLGSTDGSGWAKRRVARIKKVEGQKAPTDFPCVLPECRVDGVRGLSGRIAENGAIQFKSASPLGKMIRSALIAANSSFVANGTLAPLRYQPDWCVSLF